jgi:CheY-like chemotaxis protein
MDDKKRILVIDDEEDLCLLVKDNLEHTGQYIVRTLSNPHDAEKVCQEFMPHVILLDVVMPERKGGDVAEALRADRRTDKIPIVIMSGLGEMVYLKKRDEWKWLPNRPIVHQRGEVIKEHNPERAAYAYGVDDYIAKPFVTSALIQVVEDAIVRKKEEEKEKDK